MLARDCSDFGDGRVGFPRPRNRVQALAILGKDDSDFGAERIDRTGCRRLAGQPVKLS